MQWTGAADGVPGCLEGCLHTPLGLLECCPIGVCCRVVEVGWAERMGEEVEGLQEEGS